MTHKITTFKFIFWGLALKGIPGSKGKTLSKYSPYNNGVLNVLFGGLAPFNKGYPRISLGEVLVKIIYKIRIF